MTCDYLDLALPDIAAMQPYQPGKPIEELERELGISDIIKLASNENAMGPSTKVLDHLSTLSELSRYPDGNGFALKQSLARHHDLDPSLLTLGNGSNDILEFVARIFVTNKHQVIYSKYAFAIYSLITQTIGAEGVETPAKDWGYDLEAIQAALTEKTRLIYIADPNNPTGTCLDTDKLKQFMDALSDNIIVLLDQAYYEYALGQAYSNCIEWVEEYPNLVVSRTFSKACGLAGLRVGYSVSHPNIVDLMNRIRQPFNVNSLALTAAEVALSDKEHIQKSIEFNQTGMRQLIAGLDSMDISYIPSRANFVCIDLQQPSMNIFNQLLKEGVITRPLGDYDMPNHLRVTVGLKEENERFLSALSRVMEKS